MRLKRLCVGGIGLAVVVFAACGSVAPRGKPQPPSVQSPAAPPAAGSGQASTAPAATPNATPATPPPPPAATGPLQAQTLDVPPPLRRGPFASPHKLWLPPGFSIHLFADGLSGPRFMAFDAQGRLFVSEPGAGRVMVLADPAGKGYATQTETFASGLNRPHGLAFRNGALYVADTDQVLRLTMSGARGVIVPNLPAGGFHWTRTVGFGPDGRMYVSVGSDCNVCAEKDPHRATILRFAADGSGGAVFASGLRNAVGLAWNPADGQLWASVNGRDNLGDNEPPDELVRVQAGGFYGWPYCYGDRVPDPAFNDPARCRSDIPPTVALQAHSAPLGIAFDSALPPPFQGGLFVAFHGSWNRSVPTGYKIVWVPFRGGAPAGPPQDFARGWLTGGSAWGRPVDPVVGPDGSLYLSDDAAGAIYRITYKGP